MFGGGDVESIRRIDAGERSVIGRMAMVRIGSMLCEAMVIDAVAGENRPKRVRLQTGENAGEVRMPGEYEIVELLEPTPMGRERAALSGWQASIGD